MILEFPQVWRYAHLVWRFRDYKPNPVTFARLRDWIRQFERGDRPAILNVLQSVDYMNEREVRRILVEQNEALIRRLNAAGIATRKIIYVSIDAAGSSSAVMLNLLRDACHLERRGCRLLDSRDVLGISQVSGEINEGAIVYVDDFSGSGGQFCRSRDFAAQHLVGTFAEFFLAACICEEAIYVLAERHVEARSGNIHARAERPLHEQGGVLTIQEKTRLREYCLEKDAKGGLGYASMATNVVLYRNCPNTVPVLLRGTKGQEKLLGVFPRTDDLPVPVL
jgi:hypothetical protein